MRRDGWGLLMRGTLRVIFLRERFATGHIGEASYCSTWAAAAAALGPCRQERLATGHEIDVELDPNVWRRGNQAHGRCVVVIEGLRTIEEA